MLSVLLRTAFTGSTRYVFQLHSEQLQAHSKHLHSQILTSRLCSLLTLLVISFLSPKFYTASIPSTLTSVLGSRNHAPHKITRFHCRDGLSPMLVRHLVSTAASTRHTGGNRRGQIGIPRSVPLSSRYAQPRFIAKPLISFTTYS